MSPQKTKKKKIISLALLFTLAYNSIFLALGIIAGYLGIKYFYKKYVENGPLKHTYIDFKNWRIHLHHWIFGVTIIIYALMGGWKFANHKFFWGIVFGLIAHDFYDFNDWYKVIIRKEKNKNNSLLEEKEL